jgi:hypothetical protein
VRRFFPIFDGLTADEGVVWQDPTSLLIFLTWVTAELDAAKTYKLPSTGKDYLVAGDPTPTSLHFHLSCYQSWTRVVDSRETTAHIKSTKK